jgi:hypothetical protein
MLQLNQRGLLTPPTNILSSLPEVESTFAGKTTSDNRRLLFQKYIRYSSALQNVSGSTYMQWINGSFCTAKREPGDIDLVSFIPHEILENKEHLFRRFSYTSSEDIFGVDAYIIKVYPEGHRYHQHYIADKLYWLSQFSKTKPNRAGNIYSKGFPEIMF